MEQSIFQQHLEAKDKEIQLLKSKIKSLQDGQKNWAQEKTTQER